MEQKKSKFALALDGIVNKATEATTNFYLSQNPSSDLYGEEHIDSINAKLHQHGYKILKDELQGGWIEYGYQVQSFIKNAGDKKEKTIFFTKSPATLDDWLEKNLAKQLGWKKDQAEAQPVLKQAPSFTATKLKALQPTLTM